MTKEPPSKLVVLRPGALGDCVAAFPVLQALRAAWPGAELLAIGSPVFRLAAESGPATGWMAFDDARLTGLFAEGGTSDVLADCDLCLSYGADQDSLLPTNLVASGARRVVAWPARPAGAVHIVDHLLGAVEAAGMAAVSRRPTLRSRPEWLEEGRALLARAGAPRAFVALHPGSGGRRKRWPADRFALLAERVEGPVVWLLGPAEGEDAELRAAVRRAGVVLEPATLRELAGILACARAYVGNDSGVSHLAAALGVATVAVFVDTEPAVWAPRGERVAVVGAGAGEIELDEVMAALRNLVAT